MATASAAFTFSGCTSLAKKTASASASISATLDSLSGVSTVAWSVYSTDETTTPGDYTLVTSGPKGSTVTFTTGAAGTAGLLQCVVNGGLNPQTGAAEAAYTKRAKWFVPTAASTLEVGCVDEAFESDPTFGSTGIVNGAIRAVAAAVGVTNVTGTAPITSSGGATPAIGISAASGGAAGSMSAAHYTLVNNATDAATASTLVKRDGSSVTKLAALELGATPSTTLGQLRATAGNVLSAKIGPAGEDRTILSTDNEHFLLGSTYGNVVAQIANGVTKFRVLDPFVLGPTAVAAEFGSAQIDLYNLVKLYGGTATTATAKGHVGLDSTGRLTVYADGAEKVCLVTGDASAGGLAFTATKTANYTASWGEVVVCDATGGDFTVTLPTCSGNTDARIGVLMIGGGVVTIDGAGSETIDGALTRRVYRGQYVEAQSNGTNARTTSLRARSYVPTDFSGCTLWLKADTGVTLSGSDVTAWADQSGNSNDFSAIASHYPTISTGALAGRDVVAFDATGEQYLSGPLASALYGAAAYTILAVFRAASIDANGGSLYVAPAILADAAQAAGMLLHTTGPTVAAYAYDNGGGGTAREVTTSIALSTWTIAHAQLSTGTTGLVVSTDGGDTTSGQAPSSIYDLTGTTRIGNDGYLAAPNARFFDGDLAELIVFNRALPVGAVAKLVAYLGDRYGLVTA